jgi:hypothetical protein
MSVIKVNNITNRDGTSGPVIAGIATVSSTSHLVVPTGRTGQRFADGGENIVKDSLVLHLDARYSYTGIGTTTSHPDYSYTWYDMTGNGFDGQLYGGVGSSTDSVGALTFDGVNDYVSIFPVSSVLGPASFTVELLINFTTFSAAFFLTFADTNAGNPEMRFVAESNKLMLTYYDSGGYISINQQSNASISTGTWYHLCFTGTDKDYKIYINGSLDNSFTGNNFLYNGGNCFQSLGTYLLNGTTSYNGYANFKLATYRFYNKVLSAAEVSQNFNAVRSRFGL